MLARLNRLCGTVGPSLLQSRTTIMVTRVHKPPLIGTDPLNTPQKIIDKAVVHSDDDKWMLYEVKRIHVINYYLRYILSRFLRKNNCTTTSS